MQNITNDELSAELRRQARERAARMENLYRVRAYRSAAIAVQALPAPIGELVAVGAWPEAAEKAGVGEHLAAAIVAWMRDSVWPEESAAPVSVRRRPQAKSRLRRAG